MLDLIYYITGFLPFISFFFMTIGGIGLLIALMIELKKPARADGKRSYKKSIIFGVIFIIAFLLFIASPFITPILQYGFLL